MNINLILFGILPFIAFVIIDAFLGLKAGLISAIILALAETIYSLYEFGGLDYVSLVSLLMVCIFAFFSFKTNNSIYIKLQPVFLGICFGLILLVMQAIGKPLLLILFEKYQNLIPSELQNNINSPAVKILLARSSLILGFGFLLHAFAVLYAALRMSNWWWLFVRGVGLYVMMFLCLILARVT